MDFFYYVVQLCVFSALLALALSVYVDGLGYVTFHLVGVAGTGAYFFARFSQEVAPAFYPAGVIVGVFVGALAGYLCSEVVLPLRGDALTLATFGLGVAFFELFRYSDLTGGVYGISGIPPLVGDTDATNALVGVLLLAMAGMAVHFWRHSLGGAIVRALNRDEWAALLLGARLHSHQRLNGIFAGALAGIAGVYYASTTSFIEPRDFRATNLLIALASAILAGGRTPWLVCLIASGIVAAGQITRFLGARPAIAGPLTEILIATLVSAFVLARRTWHKNSKWPGGG